MSLKRDWKTIKKRSHESHEGSGRLNFDNRKRSTATTPTHTHRKGEKANEEEDEKSITMELLNKYWCI